MGWWRRFYRKNAVRRKPLYQKNMGLKPLRRSKLVGQLCAILKQEAKPSSLTAKEPI